MTPSLSVVKKLRDIFLVIAFFASLIFLCWLGYDFFRGPIYDPITQCDDEIDQCWEISKDTNCWFLEQAQERDLAIIKEAETNDSPPSDRRYDDDRAKEVRVLVERRDARMKELNCS